MFVYAIYSKERKSFLTKKLDWYTVCCFQDKTPESTEYKNREKKLNICFNPKKGPIVFFTEKQLNTHIKLWKKTLRALNCIIVKKEINFCYSVYNDIFNECQVI